MEEIKNGLRGLSANRGLGGHIVRIFHVASRYITAKNIAIINYRVTYGSAPPVGRTVDDSPLGFVAGCIDKLPLPAAGRTAVTT